MSNEQAPEEIRVGSLVRRRSISQAEAVAQGPGRVLTLGKKYRGARAHPAAKVQFQSTSRVLWYFLDQLQLMPNEAKTEPGEERSR